MFDISFEDPNKVSAVQCSIAVLYYVELKIKSAAKRHNALYLSSLERKTTLIKTPGDWRRERSASWSWSMAMTKASFCLLKLPQFRWGA